MSSRTTAFAGLGGRLLRLIFGLFLYALGTQLGIQANVGLAPWEAFSMGGAYATQLSFGNVVVASGVLILALVLWLRETIGVGTLLNALLIGKFVDLIQALALIPRMHGLFGGVAMLLVGQLVICLGSYFYIGAGLGCGPRDSLMVALARRLPRLPIGLIRGLLEGSVLGVGWLLGAPVGVGTLIAMFGIGSILQLTFRTLRFDVKAVAHDSLAATAALVAGGCRR